MTESGSANKTHDQSDYRSRLYERYVTLQVGADPAALRARLASAQPYLEKIVANHFPADRNVKILDVGCGYGLLLHVLRRLGYRNLAGIETSAEQVESARALGLDCVRRGDLLEVLRSGAESACDVIVAFDVLEHFTKDEVLDVLGLIFDSLKPGGTLLLHVPNGEAIFAGKVFFGDFTHQTAFTAKSLHQIAAYCGFTEIACYEDKPVMHGPVSLVRAILWWIVRTRYRLYNAIETGDPGGRLILSQNLLAVCRKRP